MCYTRLLSIRDRCLQAGAILRPQSPSAEIESAGVDDANAAKPRRVLPVIPMSGFAAEDAPGARLSVLCLGSRLLNGSVSKLQHFHAGLGKLMGRSFALETWGHGTSWRAVPLQRCLS